MFRTEEFEARVKGGLLVEVRYDHMDGEIYGWSIHSPNKGRKLWDWVRKTMTPKQRQEVDELCSEHYRECR